MRLSISNKLFAGFALLSLLTVFLGVTTFLVIEKMAESQRSSGLLQEFELRIDALETAATSQSHAAFLSVPSNENFLANLAITKNLAEKILRAEYCSPGPAPNHPDEPGSCPSLMQEARDFYPQAALAHYEQTRFTLRLINKSQLLYEQMLQATDQLPQSLDKARATMIIHQLEMRNHDLKERNNFEAIQAMKIDLQSLQNLKTGSDLAGLAAKFIANSEETHQNRLQLQASQERLSESTKRFKMTSQAIRTAIIVDSHDRHRQIRALIMFLSLCSVALTLLFWLLTSRRFSRFLNSQKKAIDSIKAGNYDYPVAKVPDDELGELSAFTKSLAVNLKEEIAKRESSQQGEKALQTQLMQAQRLESVGILAGGIAHDFNNILTGISGYADLALARLEDDHPTKRYLEIISQSGQNAKELTKQLLLFSRKQELNKQVINLNVLIANLLKMMARMIGENIVLELDPTPDLPSVMADPAQMEQVLMNMAVNSRDAMPNGGRLIIKTSAITLDKQATELVEGVDPGNFVQISITDNGAGMSDEVREKIFYPFFTTKDKRSGTGLGLATVFRIIKQHNGHVTVDSAINRGTTFNFFLPVVDADQPPNDLQRPVSEQRLTRGHETILLVDDNETVRDFVCETLEYCGYKVLTAGSGSKAVQIIHQTDYAIDLLLTDIVMPGMNGKELAEIVKQVNPGIKILFMTGYDDLSASHEQQPLPPDSDSLKKPMSIDTLSRKVREVLDH